MAGDRVAKYQRLCKLLSRKLRRPADSELVRNVACLHLLRSEQQARILKGEMVPISEIVGLRELLKPFDVAAAPAVTVKLI